MALCDSIVGQAGRGRDRVHLRIWIGVTCVCLSDLSEPNIGPVSALPGRLPVSVNEMTGVQFSSQKAVDPLGLYSDSREHGYQGPTRNVRLYRATPGGGGAVAKSED